MSWLVSIPSNLKEPATVDGAERCCKPWASCLSVLFSPAGRHWRACHLAGPHLQYLHRCPCWGVSFQASLGGTRRKWREEFQDKQGCDLSPLYRPKRIGVSYWFYPRAFHHLLTLDNQPLSSWVLTYIKVHVRFALSGAAASSKVVSSWRPSILCDVMFWLKCLPVCRQLLVTTWKEKFQ